MRTKQMTKHIFLTCISWLLIAFAIILALNVLNIVIDYILSAQSDTEFTTIGTANSAAVVLFVFGIIFFYTHIKEGFAFSISRKTIYKALAIIALIFGVLTGIFDSLILLFNQALLGEKAALMLDYSSYQQSFGYALWLIGKIALNIVSATAAMFAGLFVGGLYYRMNTPQKVVVSICVPALFIATISAFESTDSSFLPANVLKVIVDIFTAVGEFILRSPYHTSLISIVSAVLFAAFIWLLIRRAPVKTS